MEDIFCPGGPVCTPFCRHFCRIAKLYREEDFTLMFHKGVSATSISSRLGEDYLIITLFNDNVSLGLIRLRLGGAIQQMSAVFDEAEGIA